MSRTLRVVVAASSLVLGAGAFAPMALAQQAPAAVDGQQDEAVRRYDAARTLFDQGENARALVEIEASSRLLPSPNSDLLRAHVLRALGRRPEAMVAYERAIEGSVTRLRAGEARFEATLAEAGRWAAMLRAALAEITVFMSGAPAGATVTIDAAPVDLSPRGGPHDLGGRAWHEPGRAVVIARAPTVRQEVRTVELAAGAGARVAFDLAAPSVGPASPSGPRPVESSPSGPPLASWVVAGVGLAGVGVFAVFGSMAASIDSDLSDLCGNHCSPDEREKADQGKRDQVIANVGAVVGAVGIATAALIWVLSPAPRRASARAAGDRGSRAGAAPGLRVSF